MIYQTIYFWFWLIVLFFFSSFFLWIGQIVPLTLLQKLCFNKNLCQIFLILIREYKQLSLNVCVGGGGLSMKHTDANTLQQKHFGFFLKRMFSAWSDFATTKGFSFIFEFPQLPSQRPNRAFVWYVIPVQWDITYCCSTHHRLFLSFFLCLGGFWCIWAQTSLPGFSR